MEFNHRTKWARKECFFLLQIVPGLGSCTSKKGLTVGCNKRLLGIKVKKIFKSCYLISVQLCDAQKMAAAVKCVILQGFGCRQFKFMLQAAVVFSGAKIKGGRSLIFGFRRLPSIQLSLKIVSNNAVELGASCGYPARVYKL